MEKRNIEQVLQVVPELNRDWVTVWDQSKCLQYKNPKDPTGKNIYVKDLRTMMDDLGVEKKEDIVIVDDDALKCLFNQSQSLNPPSYTPEIFKTDDFLQRFVGILRDIASGKSVRRIQKDHRELNRTKEIDPALEKIILEKDLF